MGRRDLREKGVRYGIEGRKTGGGANRLSSTIGGNREMDQLYTTLQVSNITRKTKLSHIR